MEYEQTRAREPIGLARQVCMKAGGTPHGTRNLSRHRCGQTAPLTHPGHRQMTRLMAGLLAHGSSALFCLPVARDKNADNSGSVKQGLAAYSCGGSQGIGFVLNERLTLFPLASRGRGPRLENRQASGTIGGKRVVSNRLRLPLSIEEKRASGRRTTRALALWHLARCVCIAPTNDAGPGSCSENVFENSI